MTKSSGRQLELAVATLLVLAVAACSGTSDSRSASSPPPIEPGRQVAHDSTGQKAELLNRLPVLATAVTAGKRVVFSQRLVIGPDQVLLAVAEFQVTNDLGRNVFVGSQIVLAKDPEQVSGRQITQANGENVTPSMHHGQQTKTGTYVAGPADEGVRYVNLVVWAAASTTEPGDEIRVDRGYGQLSIIRW